MALAPELRVGKPFLSKSTFIAGRQCQKLLWVRYNDKSRLPALDPAAEAIFDQGQQVGQLAKKLFPSGIEIVSDTASGFEEVLEKTLQAMPLRKPLFEAAFAAGRTFARSDILNPTGVNSWELIEVKSSTALKPVHIDDLAFQKHVLTAAGVAISGTSLLLIDNGYVRGEVIEAEKLFKKVDVSSEVAALDVARLVQVHLESIDASSEPTVAIGDHCDHPYTCGLKGNCWSFLPEDHVFTLIRGGKRSRRFFGSGVYSLRDIPSDADLTAKQQIQLETLRRNDLHIDKAAVGSFLESLVYPIHCLDFETIGTPIPIYRGTRPFQQVPFQFSLHILHADGTVDHSEFLAQGTADPRPAFLAHLKDHILPAGTLLAYNKSFEEQRLKELADAVPFFADWIRCLFPRFRDLLHPFSAMSLYHPSQGGSASIKNVLPAFTGRSYADLPIKNGEEAGRAFLRLNDADSALQAELRERLLRYCHLDTEGMVLLLKVMQASIRSSHTNPEKPIKLNKLPDHLEMMYRKLQADILAGDQSALAFYRTMTGEIDATMRHLGLPKIQLPESLSVRSSGESAPDSGSRGIDNETWAPHHIWTSGVSTPPLILGESTYSFAGGLPMIEYVPAWCYRTLAAPDHFFSRLFNELTPFDAGKSTSLERWEFWTRVAFTNFVSDPIGSSPSARPSVAQYTAAMSRLAFVLEALNPSAVLIIGKEQSKYSAPVVEKAGIKFAIVVHPCRHGEPRGGVRSAWLKLFPSWLSDFGRK